MGMNILTISDANGTGILEADYNFVDEYFTVAQNLTTRDWDKAWDKTWNSSNQWSAFQPISRDMVGRFFQYKHEVANTSEDFVFIGISVNYDQIENPALCVR
jgi:hypothetical protein